MPYSSLSQQRKRRFSGTFWILKHSHRKTVLPLQTFILQVRLSLFTKIVDRYKQLLAQCRHYMISLRTLFNISFHTFILALSGATRLTAILVLKMRSVQKKTTKFQLVSGRYFLKSIEGGLKKICQLFRQDWNTI